MVRTKKKKKQKKEIRRRKRIMKRIRNPNVFERFETRDTLVALGFIEKQKGRGRTV